MTRILVANRGEIALRVLRACQELGHESVIVHSEADADTRPVRLADRSVCIGPAEAERSYLDPEAILSAARMNDVDALHPGYGMLAENAAFARRVEASDCTWIGPSSEIIRTMGQKTEARRVLKEAGLPVLPGSDGDVTSVDEAKKVAEEIGYPLMLKAAEGGGGRGISRVETDENLEDQFQRTQAEAEAAFGSGRLYIEKLIERPRHVEFQVMGDGEGEVLQFFERECSIQRRHQKLVEEAPSPAVDASQRAELADSIVEALGKLNYSNAGTLEFIMDPEGNLYILEVNTRIQVEHPVTEMICGRDLIKIQIETALSGSLPLSQSDIGAQGHALEVRVCAEDPTAGFAPVQGTVEHLNFPSGPGIRVDSYLEAGTWISPYYDSMVAKIIAWDRDRAACMDRMLRALSEMELEGFRTTLPLYEWLLRDEGFRDGQFHTGYLDDVSWQEQLGPAAVE